MIYQLPAPDLSVVATGGATLYLLEGLGFSTDAKTLLVRATYLDDADAVPSLRYGVWLFDVQSKAYTACLNLAIGGSASAARGLDVRSAVIQGTSADPVIVAETRARSGDGVSELAWLKGGVVDPALLVTLLGEELGIRIERYALSNDARFLAIQTDASTLAPEASPDANDSSDIYLFDLLTRKVERVSFVGGAEVPFPVILGNVVTAGGKVLVSMASAAVFVTGNVDTNAATSDPTDLYLWTRAFDATGLTGTASFTLASQAVNGRACGAVGTDAAFAVTPEGAYFNSASAQLVAGDANAASDAFWRSASGTVSRVALGGVAELSTGATLVSASAGGHVAALLTTSPELPHANGAQQLVVTDLTTQGWQVLSTSGSTVADDDVISAVISPNGQTVAFTSAATNLAGTPAALSGGLFLSSTGFAENHAPSGAVTIAGTATQGQTLSAANTLADADGLGTIGYQWYADGVAISGATGASLALAQAQVGKAITVAARYTDGFGNAESIGSAATAAVANVNDAPTGSVTIGGKAEQGQTLTAANTLADADGLGTIGYQWYADGVAISGATGASLALAQAQVGKAVTVTARYTDALGTAESVASAATAKVANVNDAPTGSVTIGGTPTQGQTLSAANTLADEDGLGAIGYQWYADGAAISGATGSTLTLAQAQVGKAISVAARYTDALGSAESVSSAATAAVTGLPLEGIAYHWKSHVLLSTVQVSALSAGAIATSASDLVDLRAASYSAATGTLSVEVWSNAASGVNNFDFEVAAPRMSGATFTSALSNTWVVQANSAATGTFTVQALNGDTGSTGLSGATRLGTLKIQLATGTTDAQIALTNIELGGASLPAQAVGLYLRSTGTNGAYTIESLASGSYALSASRAATDSGSAVSSADALAALKIAVGLNPNPDPDGSGPLLPLKVSPYQIMAADVNQDGRVTSADALAILKMAVKLSTALPQEWFFVEERRDFWDETANGGQGAFTLSRTSASWDHAIVADPANGPLNLVGVLKGDVNGSWAAPSGSQDLDLLDPTYFQQLMLLVGVPGLDQWGGP